MSRRPIKAPRLTYLLNGKSSSASAQNAAKKKSPLGNQRFSWYSIEGLALPCIFRNGNVHAPVRILEDKLLNKMHFRSGTAIDAAFRNRQMLVSTYLTDEEAQLLSSAPGSEYGAFTTKDLVVDMEEFRQLLGFLKPLQSQTPAPAPATLSATVLKPAVAPKLAKPPVSAVPPEMGGWIQVNNSVIPYLHTCQTKFLPLSVVMNAAGLLGDLPSRGLPLTFPTEDQFRYLNDLCRAASLDFVFDASSALVSIHSLMALTVPTPYMRELPTEDPFSHARFVDDVPINGVEPKPTATSGPSRVEPAVPVSSSGLIPYSTSHFITGGGVPRTEQTDLWSGAALQHARSQANSSYLPPAQMPQLVRESVMSASTGPSLPDPPATPAAVPQPAYVIEAVQFRGRKISSLRRPAENASYVLLEAICRVFFPQQRNADGFVRAVDTLFRVPQVCMTVDEEQEFIRAFQLPTTRLRNNRLIRLDILTDIFPRLEAVFHVQPENIGEGEVIGSVLSLPGLTDGADTAAAKLAALMAGQPAPTDNNSDPDDAKPARKRRRKDIQEVIVLD